MSNQRLDQFPYKVDIRQIRRNEMLEQIDVTKQLSEKSLLEKLKFKLDKRDEKENFLVPRDIFTSCMESYKEHRKKHEKVKKEEDEELQDEYKSFNLGLKDKDYLEKESECETTQEELVDDVIDDTIDFFKDSSDSKIVDKVKKEEGKVTVSNTWSTTPKNVVPAELNLDECPPLSGYHEGSIRNLVPKPVKVNFDGYTGYDICDVEDCIICRESDQKLDESR